MHLNKNLFITGATSGVGYAMVKILLNQKYNLYVTGRNEEKLVELEKLGVHVFKADLTKIDEMEQVIAKLPPLNIAILNAGIATFDYTRNLSDDAIDEMLQLNIMSQMKLTKRLLPLVSDQFIFIGSQAGKVATPKAAVYAATKHALIGFTNGLRLEQPNHTITVIHPGPIDSPFLDHADSTATYRDKMKGLLLTAEEVAHKTIATIGTKKREVNIPWYMGITSKLYMLSPGVVEVVGKPFFLKK